MDVRNIMYNSILNSQHLILMLPNAAKVRERLFLFSCFFHVAYTYHVTNPYMYVRQHDTCKYFYSKTINLYI